MKHLKSLLAAVTAACALTTSAEVVSTTLTVASPTLSEDFDSMYNDVDGATKALPRGWYVYEHMSGPYDFTGATWVESVNNLNGGANTAGTYNLLNTEDVTDRAVGGQSSDASGRCHGISYMTALTNGESTDVITSLAISYNVEKYRKNSNAGGFRVQLYVSTDGISWTSAGDDFCTYYPKDDASSWPTPRPFDVRGVNHTLLADVAPGATIYLAWNYAVNSGTTYANAQCIGIDDITVTATFADPSTLGKCIYIEDVTGWEQLGVTVGGTSLAPNGYKSVNGVTYAAYDLPAALPATLTVGNAVYYNIPETATLTENRDYYFTATRHNLVAIADPATYTGYADPTRPAFVASGLYIRGEVNSWGASADWQFSREGEGNYALYDKTLSGAFKIADASWSSSANYGANGGSLVPGVPYALVCGSNPDNIGMGNLKISAKEIRLEIDGDNNATMTILTDDDATGITKVYLIGDHNGWNYMDDSGILTYEDGYFKGSLSMPKGTGSNLSTWMIYQTLGMGGAWGLEADATTSATSGSLVKGAKGHAAVRPGSYDIAFDIATGEYTLTEQAATPVGIKISPAQALLVPGVPDEVKIFSLNNSLIEYNDQPNMFMDLANAMGKTNVSWTRHTNLGKSLDYHWDEGDGLTDENVPGAKMMVRSDAWTHIILQEQSTRPASNTDAFYASVRKWVEYIRENCPNPNAVVILPLNWVKSDDITNPAVYKAGNDNNVDIYTRIADELGVVICPVSQAYNIALDANGTETKRLIYSVNNDGTDDNVHPTPASTYLAACMEYSLIFGEPVSSITWAPETAVWRDPAEGNTRAVSAEDCAKMRLYGQQAMDNFTNKINHTASTVKAVVEVEYDNGLSFAPESPVAYTVSGGGSIDQTGIFTADGTEGTYTITASVDGFTASMPVTVAKPVTEVVTYPAIILDNTHLTSTENFDAMADGLALPEAWRIDRNLSAPRQVGTYSLADTDVMYSGGISLPSNAKNGTWSFGPDASDRAVGGITTSVSGGTRGVNVYTHILNNGTKRLTNATVSYDVEKYRDGNNTAGFTVKMYYSIDGKNWTAAGDAFTTDFAPSAATAGSANVPMETVHATGLLPVDIYPGLDLYLAWNISVTSGTACAGAPALAIDNFSVETELPAIPTAEHYIYVNDCTGWGTLGLYAYGASELFGAWPGKTNVDEVKIEGTDFKVFLYDVSQPATYNLIFNNWNHGQQTPDYAITEARDYYLTVYTDHVEAKIISGVEDIAAPTQCAIAVNGDYAVAPGATAIEVYSISGNVVARAKGGVCNIAALPAGVYIVGAYTPRSKATVKIVK